MSVGLPQHSLVAGATTLAVCVPISFFGGDVLTGKLYFLWRDPAGVTASQVCVFSPHAITVKLNHNVNS